MTDEHYQERVDSWRATSMEGSLHPYSTKEALQLLNSQQGSAYFVPHGYEPLLIAHEELTMDARNELRKTNASIPVPVVLGDCRLPPFIVTVRKVPLKMSRSQSRETVTTIGTANVKNPPRPPNAFILYRKAKQASILAANQGLSNNDVSKIIGNMWQNESDAVKAHYQSSAHVIKLEHQMLYPNYRYTPRKPKTKPPSSSKVEPCDRERPRSCTESYEASQMYGSGKLNISQNLQSFSLQPYHVLPDSAHPQAFEQMQNCYY